MHVATLLLAAALYADTTPPPIQREFRAVWVATVGNIDWPSKPGLSTWEQQQELLAILNRTVELNMNAVVFHIRPGADALYESKLEPWAQWITGRQGRGPEPAWDPLAFAVTEAHKRGLELHAWFNPYRAHYTRDTAVAARSHISNTDPQRVVRYDRYLWMDPGDPEIRRRAVRVIADVVKRYDVDGVHIDDYFYPYPVNDSANRRVDFPDSATYARYMQTGGTLSKDDWRRHNVDLLVEAMFKAVRATKPWVKVGVSPFGIWRPGNPPQITGFDAYNEIYADSKKWLQNAWVDYLAPQLYWPIDRPQQSFPVLLDWWLGQNTAHRHVWPGLASYRVTETGPRHIPATEIVNEIRLTRERPTLGGSGHIHFNMTALMRGPDSLVPKLAALYAEPALVPASPWLGATPPAKPIVALRSHTETGEAMVSLTPRKGAAVWLWTVRTLGPDGWTSEVIPGAWRLHRLPVDKPERVVVTAVSRTGVESVAVVVSSRSREATVGIYFPAKKIPTRAARVRDDNARR